MKHRGGELGRRDNPAGLRYTVQMKLMGKGVYWYWIAAGGCLGSSAKGVGAPLGAAVMVRWGFALKRVVSRFTAHAHAWTAGYPSRSAPPHQAGLGSEWMTYRGRRPDRP